MDTTLQPDFRLERKLNRFAWAISAAVLFLVGTMRQIKFDPGIDFGFLPPFHAGLNAFTAIVLVIAYYFIRNKKVEAHRKSIYVALGSSVLFLLSYVLYHITTPETQYGGAGAIRYAYFFLLITHIVLAGGILPFILFTFIRAYTGQYARHRRLARWVYWVWLYVAVSGPLCYLMLQPYY